MGHGIQEWTKENLWKTAFKGCLPQISPGPFLNTLSQMTMRIDMIEKRIHIEKLRAALLNLMYIPQCFKDH